MKNSYPLTRRNVWMLQAIYIAKFEGDTAGLERLIGTADWLDHSLPTFAEFNDAVYHLRQAKLLVLRGQLLRLSRSAKLRFTEFEKFYPAKQRDALCAGLNIVKQPPGSYDPNVITAPEVFISEVAYNQAIQTYTQGPLERNGL